MQIRLTSAGRGLLALLLVPFMAAACASAAEEVFVEAQPSPGEVVIDQRGAITVIDMEIDRLANATEVAFAELGIALEEREIGDDGVELEGKDGDQTVEVDIDRDDDEVLTEVRVSVTRDGITFDGARSGEILRRILALAR
jgi:hypothetical protein